MILPRLSPEALRRPRRATVDPQIAHRAGEIVDAVRADGEAALRDFARRFDGLAEGDRLIYDRVSLSEALAAAPAEARLRLDRIAARIRRFAAAQMDCLRPLEMSVPGGEAGHELAPVEGAGCYAPGGRYPLPSSALMTVIPARVAGVATVWVASPRPAPVTIWAAAAAGADGLLAAGGAHAIAALAFGAGELPAADVVVGPGNLWVTVAKQLVAGEVAVDLPAGPSELLIIADGGSDPRRIAADLLAQAEHDELARPWLLSTDGELIDLVEAELERQLVDLPTAAIARTALAGGGAVLCGDDDEVVRLADSLAPEHLQVSVAEPERFAGRLRHYGAIFLGDGAAEVFGDYGAGPNHVLPTGGAARHSGGLSVLAFLRLRTWMRAAHGSLDDELVDDVAWLATQEGLAAHARAARSRGGKPGGTAADGP